MNASVTIDLTIAMSSTMPAVYGISYPTVRLRLDRLITKIQVTDNQDIRSDFERLLRVQHVEGKIDAETLKTLLAAYRDDIARRDEVAPRRA